MKKMIALILSAVMLTGSLPVAAAPSGSTFSDVPAGHWAAADIAGAVKAGYVSGLPDGTFKPDKPVSRAEFIKMRSTRSDTKPPVRTARGTRIM